MPHYRVTRAPKFFMSVSVMKYGSPSHVAICGLINLPELCPAPAADPCQLMKVS
jgi:hypothetical protein